MFTATSLCPGGAFLMCESAAEYDPNLQSNVTPEDAELVRREATEVVRVYDPLQKLLNKTRDMYAELREIMDNVNLEPGDPELAMTDLDRIDKFVTECANMMRCCLIKQNAMMCLTDDRFGNDWATEDFHAHLGQFMKHKNRLKQNGYNKFTYTVEVLNCMYSYGIQNMLNLYIESSDGLPDFPFDMDNIRNCLNAYGPYADVFTTTEDMFNCFFSNPERLARLEESRGYTIDLDELMQSIASSSSDRPVACTEREFPCRMIKFISCRLRTLKRTIYDLEVGIMDQKFDLNSDCYHKLVRSVVSGAADLFYVPMIMLIANSYELRLAFARRNAITDYTNQLLTLKNPDIQ